MDMVEYNYPNGDRHDPRWYENRPDMLDPDTATVWALHLHVGPHDRDAILGRASELERVTGEYTFGDSWREWGEPSKGDDDVHMVLYFRASPDDADAVGSSIVSLLLRQISTLVPDHYVTTAGDYAELAWNAKK